MDPWAGGFCFCAIIQEPLEEALVGTDVVRACSRRGGSEATGQEQGRGEGGMERGYDGMRCLMLVAGRRLCERDVRGKSYCVGGSRYFACANNYWMTPGPVAGQQDTNGRDTAMEGCLLN